MRGTHSGQGRGIDSSYLSGDDSTAEHVDSGALHHGQYTPELSAGTPSHVPSSYASPDPPTCIRPSEPRVELRLRGTEAGAYPTQPGQSSTQPGSMPMEAVNILVNNLMSSVVQCFDERLRTVVQEHGITTPIEPTTWMQLLPAHLRPSVPPPPASTAAPPPDSSAPQENNDDDDDYDDDDDLC
ncbi:hypothetical protein Dimus_026887 [Dionaea muscipula]